MRVRANREMIYMTRRLQAGDEFDATPIDARFLLADQSVEEVGRQAAAPGKPKAGALEDMRRDELLDVAKARGVNLPPGYVGKPDLIDYIEGRKIYEVDSEKEDDDA